MNGLNDAARRAPADSFDDDLMAFACPLPRRHPCNDAWRLDFNHATRFRVQYWGRIQTVDADGISMISGRLCPF